MDAPSSPKLIQLSSNEEVVKPDDKEMEPEEEGDEYVPQELSQEELEDYEGDFGNEDSNLEMAAVGSDSGDKDDDFSVLDYDPSQDH